MSLPTAVLLNKLALAIPLKTNMCKILFRLSDAEQIEQNRMRAEAMLDCGLTEEVVRAFIGVGPLLMERDAISQFLALPTNARYATALPNPQTPAQAVTFAEQQYGPLKPADAVELAGLLLERM